MVLATVSKDSVVQTVRLEAALETAAVMDDALITIVLVRTDGRDMTALSRPA